VASRTSRVANKVVSSRVAAARSQASSSRTSPAKVGSRADNKAASAKVPTKDYFRYDFIPGVGPGIFYRVKALSLQRSTPVLIRFPLHGWRVRVLALDPVRGPTRAVAGVPALGHQTIYLIAMILGFSFGFARRSVFCHLYVSSLASTRKHPGEFTWS
jgi:hypothetical protein